MKKTTNTKRENRTIYNHFILNSQLEKFREDIEIISVEMFGGVGIMARFYCDNEKALDDIFGDE